MGSPRLIPPQALLRPRSEPDHDVGAASIPPTSTSAPREHVEVSSLSDVHGRPLRDLRLSVTDRCNLRCSYCMPKEVYGPGYHFLPRSELLSFEELRDVAAVFVRLGVKKLRITGGEPLLRAQLPALVQMLHVLGAELALTTNGLLLEKHAAALKAAGLDRVTVSLDALDVETFRKMSGTDHHTPDEVLRGIETARHVGLAVKVNTVIRRGVNESDVLPLVRRFRHSGVPLRFIEYMDVGSTNGWSTRDFVPSEELRRTVETEHALEAIAPAYEGETARRYVYADGAGELGFISSVTQPFCGDCTRARLSAKGTLYTCLFASTGVDLRSALRDAGVDAVQHLVEQTWRRRTDRYSEVRGRAPSATGRIEMSYIGG